MPRKTKVPTKSRILDEVGTKSETATAINNITPENPVLINQEKTKSATQSNLPNESIFNGPEGELVVDIFETNKDFVVLTAIAGVQIEDLDIAVEEDMMIIKGQRANPDNNPDKKYFYQECYWGSFSKKVVLPQNINTRAADAQINKGILTIKIPKLKEENVKIA